MSTSAFGVDHGEVSKASREERRTAGSGKAHKMIAGAYTRAGTHHISFDPGKTPGHVANELRSFNEAAGHNGGNALYHQGMAHVSMLGKPHSHRVPTKMPKGKVAAVGAGVAAVVTGAHEARKKKLVAKADAKPAWKRPSQQNTRKENVKVGATVGGGIWGGLGAAGGSHHGAKQAKAGVKSLKAIGAAPSRARTAGIVTGNALRHGGKTAAVLGGAGAALGATEGALMQAKKKRVSKAALKRVVQPKKSTVGKSAFGVQH